MQGSQSAKPLRFLQKVEQPVSRPPTPSVHIPQEVCVSFVVLETVVLVSRPLEAEILQSCLGT